MLFLNQSILTELKSMVESHDEECCGFLFGYEMGSQRMITSILQVKNVSPVNRERTFAISSKDYRQAENFADMNNLKLLGVYHSHPNSPAVPSEFDSKAAQPYFSYVILSVTKWQVNSVRSWTLNNNLKFEEEPLSIININQHKHGYRNHPNPAA